MFLVAYIDLGWIILFIGNLYLSADDLVQYCIVTTSLLSFSGGGCIQLLGFCLKLLCMIPLDARGCVLNCI